MFFRQVLHEDLGCASYVIAGGGQAVVVDPKWEIEDYLELAAGQELALAHVLETHDHADHVSGRGRLTAATGAEARELDDGEALELGDVRIRALATPGHRPEHLAFLVEDCSRLGRPWLVLTGDALFVGDVGRPDLAVDPQEGAHGLFRSTRRLLELDDDVELWPGHIGGSLCGGGGMSEKPSSTIGFERRTNPWCRFDDEDEFVRRLTAATAPQPPNFERIVGINREGPPAEAASLEPLPEPRARELLEAGAVLLDGRDPRDFDARHEPGALNVTTAHSGVGTRAAWVVDPDAPVLVGEPSMVRLLEAVGIFAVHVWGTGPRTGPFQTTPALDVAGLAERLQAGDVVLLDVREDGEWEEGHVEGSLHVPYHELRDGPPDLPDGAPLAVVCSAGNRSALAASLLRRHGVDRVLHVADGGIEQLPREGIELVRG